MHRHSILWAEAHIRFNVMKTGMAEAVRPSFLHINHDRIALRALIYLT